MVLRGLWPKLILAISVAFLCLFAGFAFLGRRALHVSSEHVLQERLVIAQMAANQIDDYFLEAVNELESAALLYGTDNTAWFDSSKQHDLLLVLSKIGFFDNGVLLLDETGKILLAYPEELNINDLPPLTNATTEEAFSVSDPFMMAGNGRPAIAVTISLKNESGNTSGYLSGIINLEDESLKKPLQEAARLGHTGHATLITQDGSTVIATLPLSFLSSNEHPDFYPEAMKSTEPVIGTTPFALYDIPGEHQGEPHVMAVAPLQYARLGVAIGGDEDETFAGLWQLQREMGWFGGFVLLLVWGLSLFVTRQLLIPVRQVTDAARKIASGELDTPLKIQAKDEFGEMAEALEKMRRQLLGYIDQLTTWNKTLQFKVNERTKELREERAITQRLLHKTIYAQEEERMRLARELHDEIGQMLTAIEISLTRLENRLPESDQEAIQRLQKCEDLITTAVSSLRAIISELRPPVLDKLGLQSALHWIAEQTLTPANITYTINNNNLPPHLPDPIETILYRIAQEAINNIAKHSQATQTQITFQHTHSELIMTITDNGQGFTPQTIPSSPGSRSGWGLAGLAERAALVNGTIKIISQPGQGTTIKVHIPANFIDKCTNCPYHDQYDKECVFCTAINQFNS